MKALAILSLILTATATLAAEPTPTIQVDAAIPGGNIIVDSIKGDTINVHRDLRDTAGDWFYYCFRVRNAAGRTITVNFTQRDPTTSMGPAVSVDGGKTWKWLGAENMTRYSDTALAVLSVDSSIIRSTFHYSVPKDAPEVRFCLAMPYFESNLKAFLQRHEGSPNLRVTTLCKTKKGRDTEALHLGRLDGKAELRALITARHHACEMTASHALEGIMETILTDPTDGKWLREHVEFLIIPFMDKDGVEDGDQGKNRKPHDHNRDYAGPSIYPSVAALKALAPKWSEGKLRFAMDLHCPAHRYPDHEVIYGPSGDFAKILETVETGPLVFKPRGNANTSTNKAPARAEKQAPAAATQARSDNPGGRSFGSWARTVPSNNFAGLIELPYAVASGRPVTDETAQRFGQDVAKAIRQYLEGIQ